MFSVSMARATVGASVVGLVGMSGFLAAHVALAVHALSWVEYCWCVLGSLGLYALALAVGHIGEHYADPSLDARARSTRTAAPVLVPVRRKRAARN